MNSSIDTLVERAIAGERAALARLLTFVETGNQNARRIDQCILPHLGNAYSIGITGAPGAGKSTLVSALIEQLRARQEQEKVAVLAVDPSSPISHGAILGDRVRMQAHLADPLIFIRSMASRGHLGGLSLATMAAIRLLDATDWRTILVETVGVGQVEMEIASATDTVVVVLNPGWGDAVQANKAGLMEIADVFVINKADRPGLAETRRDLEGALAPIPADHCPDVVETVALEGRGLEGLVLAINRHRTRIQSSGELLIRRRLRARSELTQLVSAEYHSKLQQQLNADATKMVIAQVDNGTLDLASAANTLVTVLAQAMMSRTQP